MEPGFFDVRRHPLPWGMPLAVTIAWHVVHTVLYSNPQYLFFVCYAANVLLCLGIFARSALLVGAGFGWLLVAFPLWLYDAIRISNWEPSCTLFHVTGLAVGAAAIRSYRLPRLTWAFSLALAAVLQLCARLFTDEALNINSAFRIYDGWEGVYPNYAVFYLSALAAFGLAFAALTYLNNRYLAPEGDPRDG